MQNGTYNNSLKFHVRTREQTHTVTVTIIVTRFTQLQKNKRLVQH